MHRSAHARRKWFFSTYKNYLETIGGGCVRILDVGGKNYNDLWEDDFALLNHKRDILDVQESPEVTIVPQDPYHWSEIADETYDLVYSANTFQHIDFFWLTVKEIKRVLKKNGIFMMVAPSTRYDGSYPVVNWAFNKDGLYAMARWAGLEVIDASTAGIPSVDVGVEWDYPLDDAVLIALKGRREDNPFFEQVEKLNIQRYHRDSNMVKAEMLANWLNIYQRTSRGISQWFEEHQFRRVNLYGMGNLGQLLAGELTSAGIEILNIFDRNPGKSSCSWDSVNAEARETLTVITLNDDCACLEVYEKLADKGFHNIRLLSKILEEFLSAH